MKTGIELITQERQEQIEKHGFDINRDLTYDKGELISAATFCLNPKQGEWPNDWSKEYKDKMLSKDRYEQLKIAGALIAAEIDRLRAIDEWIEGKEIID